MRAHVDGALHAHERRHHGGRSAVLSCPGLGDEALLAHALGQKRLSQGVVALVRAAVHQVLALEDDAGSAVQRQVAALVDGGGAAQVGGA